MYGQTLPPSAKTYDQRHRTESAAAKAALERLWQRMDGDFDTSYARIESRVLATTLLAQQRLTILATDYMPSVLEDTGQTRAIIPAAQITTAPLVGVAGDGR